MAERTFARPHRILPLARVMPCTTGRPHELPRTKELLMSVDKVKEDGFVPDDDLASATVPEGWDRRAFMMRSAMIGAVAVLSGCTPPTPKETAAQATSAPPVAPKVRPVRGSRRRQEVQGAGHDDARGVLQGRPGAVELAHDRADADHLRLLSALHEAAGRPAGQGHGAAACTCSAASAPPARATAPSAPRSPASSARSPPPSIRVPR